MHQAYGADAVRETSPTRGVLEVECDLRHCELARRRFEGVGLEHGLHQDELFGIGLALNDALWRAVQHGNSSEPARRVHIEYEIDPMLVRITLTADGNAFAHNGPSVSRHPGKRSAVQGSDLFYVRHHMSGVWFDPSGDRVEMWKCRSSGHRPRAPARRAVRSSRRVLLAEDDGEMRELLREALEHAGYDVTECSDGWSLLEHLHSYFLASEGNEEWFDVVVSDIRMPAITGLEVLEDGRTLDTFPPMILITAFGDEAVHDDARRFGAAAILDKPFDVDDLILAVQEIAPSNM